MSITSGIVYCFTLPSGPFGGVKLNVPVGGFSVLTKARLLSLPNQRSTSAQLASANSKTMVLSFGAGGFGSSFFPSGALTSGALTSGILTSGSLTGGSVLTIGNGSGFTGSLSLVMGTGS